MKIATLAFTALFFLFLVPTSSQAQVWAKVYRYNLANSSLEIGDGIIETANGDLVVAVGGVGNLLRFNKDGDLLWRQFYPEFTMARDVVETPDGGLATMGVLLSGARGFLLKTDKNGNKQWSKTLDDMGADPYLRINNAGGFTIISPYSTGINFMETDKNGNVLNKVQLPIRSTRFTQLGNDNYILVDNNGSGEMMSVTSDFSVVWEATLPGCRSVADAGNNNFVILGRDSSVFLAKYDKDGQQTWRQDYPQLDITVLQRVSNKVVVNDNGDIAFIAFTDGLSAFIAKTDSLGNLLCAKAFQMDPNYSVVITNLTTTQDNGYVLVGGVGRNDTGNSNSQDLFMMKTDELCQTATAIDYVEIVPTQPDTVYSKKFIFEMGPNPCADYVKFKIHPTGPLTGDISLFLYDILGREMQRMVVTEGEFIVMTDELASGIYTIEFKQGNQKIGKRKLIVQR